MKLSPCSQRQEKKKRREAEIAGLKEALEVCAFASFLILSAQQRHGLVRFCVRMFHNIVLKDVQGSVRTRCVQIDTMMGQKSGGKLGLSDGRLVIRSLGRSARHENGWSVGQTI